MVDIPYTISQTLNQQSYANWTNSNLKFWFSFWSINSETQFNAETYLSYNTTASDVFHWCTLTEHIEMPTS